MLRGIRNASANWLGRAVMGVVMGLLALSFAVWGINDIFRGFGRSTLAKIGDTEIPIEQFRRVYNERLQQIGRQIGHPLPPEQAAALGLNRQVLGEMVAEAALDQRARQMRLGLSDAQVVQRIMSDPTFRSPTGSFDRYRFEELLRSAGYSEQRFITEQRRLMLRRQIVKSLSGDLPTPKAWLEAINQFQNEERNIEYVALGAAQAGDIPQPTDEELNKYFDARKILFRAPEYRKITVVQLLPSELGKWTEVSDAEIKAAYDEHHARFVIPERRHVEQMVFQTAAEAEAADAKLKAGMTLAALAAERGLKETDIDLGTVAKSDIVDPAVADAAFALKDGEISAPVKGKFGSVIVGVLKIEPEQTKPLAEVAQQIRTEIATERAKAQVLGLHDKIEDARAGGSTLDDAAKKAGLPVSTFDIDRSGRNSAGKVVAGIPHGGEIVTAAFASDVGVENDPLNVDGGYIYYDVAGITPARDRTLAEVKDEVETRWREDETASRLKVKAEDILGKLRSGNTLEALAKTDDLTIETADQLKRGKPTGSVSAKAIAAVFHTAKDAYGSAQGDKPGDWMVFRVTAVTVPQLDPNSPESKRLEELVERQESNDIFGEYVAWLQDELGTSINQAALAQAMSNSSSNSVPDTD